MLHRDQSRDWLIDDEWRLHNGNKVPAHLRGSSEVVNDINGNLMNFWQVLAHEHYFRRFQRIIAATPFSQPEWWNADPDNIDPQLIKMRTNHTRRSTQETVLRAVNFFVRARQSMAGRGDCFTPLTRDRTRGGRNAWWNCIEGLSEVHERLKGVVVLNDDALKVIKQQDGPNTLNYCDPPYIHETRSSIGEYGDHEMSLAQHHDLLTVLAGIEGRFLLSGYHSELYDDFASTHHWRCEEYEIDNKASAKKVKEKKVECLWIN